jgi:hypothetical protein
VSFFQPRFQKLLIANLACDLNVLFWGVLEVSFFQPRFQKLLIANLACDLNVLFEEFWK